MGNHHTKFTKKFAGHSGIGELMEDLGKAMASGDMLMLGGGNPASIPEVKKLWRDRLNELLKTETELDNALGNYDTPQGHHLFMKELADFLNRHYDFNVTEKNIAVTNGSQTAMFNLMNLLGGTGEDGIMRKILFPLVPEYIGYADQHLEQDAFLALKPIIQEIGENRFKYKIDFDALENVTDPLGALCVSRPTNPTGNVLTDNEIEKLQKYCKSRNIPLIIDNAYGAPFPQILFQDIKPIWNEGIVLSMSLSKIGLPSTRTGIIVANEEIIKAVSSVNAITNLSTGSLGQVITYPLLKDDRLFTISKEIVKPFYHKKSIQALEWIDKYFEDFLYKAHVSEGALFLWLWFPDLPITTEELYQKLKLQKVLIIPGKYFFYGLEKKWIHSEQCIRITYSQSSYVVKNGIKIIAETIKNLNISK